jgi:hypothetical protein
VLSPQVRLPIRIEGANMNGNLKPAPGLPRHAAALLLPILLLISGSVGSQSETPEGVNVGPGEMGIDAIIVDGPPTLRPDQGDPRADLFL